MTAPPENDEHPLSKKLELRRIPLAGSRNLRDLGGYPAGSEGRSVRWGMLFRSGHFGELAEEARPGLAGLGIETVIDFRTPHERTKQTSVFHEDHRPAVHELTIDPGSHEEIGQRIAAKGGSISAVVGVMQDLNRSFVRDHADAYREMFVLLAGSAQPAHVIHCASGKDRTGVGAALILAALGVERSLIIEDFMLTNAAFGTEREVARALEDFAGSESGLGVSSEQLRPMFQVRPIYLLSAFDEIERTFGGIAAYLEGPMGLRAADLTELRDRYLADDPAAGR